MNKQTPLKRYVIQSSGPSLGGRGTNVLLREEHTMNEIVVTFSKFKKMEYAGQVVTPAFMPRENRPRNVPNKPLEM